VAGNKFQIHAIDSIDQALALLSGIEVGQLDEQGQYPEGSFNASIAKRLQLWIDVHKHEKESSDED
jgi:hypothetical protein